MKAENSRISELILKAKSGDKAAFEDLYKITSPKAYFVTLKICKNEHDAEDILQESYIKVLEKIDTVDPEGNFTAWLYQIVANKSKNFMKAKKPVLFSEEEEKIIGSLPDEDLSFTPEEKVDKEELRSEVMAAVDELTAEKRACVMMMYFGDMSVSEIAQSLEVPVSTVKNRLFTARKDLKNKFEKKGITALYSAAPLGVVIWALGKTGETTAAAFASSTASAAVLAGVSTTAVSTAAATTAAASTTAAAASTTAATASTAAATGTGIAAKVAALSVAQKVVAGVAAVSVIGGSTAGVVTVVKNNVPEETTSYVEEVTTAPSQSEEYAFAVIPTEESTTAESTTDVTEPSATVREEETTTRKSAASTSVTYKETTTQKQTTTRKPTTTKPTTTKATTTRPTTARPTTTESTTEEETTTKPTTTQPTTTEPTTQAPATVAVEVIDMNEDVVDSFTLSVPADTEMTWEYLVSQIKAKGHEPKAGIYGDAVGAVAQAGKTYSITAEL